MARTPVAGADETKVTAFLVTPDMPGFEVIEARMDKCGIRGTATGRLRLQRTCSCRARTSSGQVGKGLRVALTVLDFGRTTFGASCTGAAKACLKAAAEHAKKRVQFKQPLAEFELVKKKIAFMAAHAFAMEATTAECAALHRPRLRGLHARNRHAQGVVHRRPVARSSTTPSRSTAARLTSPTSPIERMMRDARINMIGEGANDVLRAFIALVGMRGVGEQLKGVLKSWEGLTREPWKELGALAKFGVDQMGNLFTVPEVPVKSADLKPLAKRLARRVHDFGQAVQRMLMTYRENILQMQYVQERIADAACELYASACTLSRMDLLATYGNGHPDEVRRDLVAGLTS